MQITRATESVTTRHKVPKKEPKKPINLSVKASLLKKAKELGVNLSKIFEESLEEKVRQAEAEEWLKENKEALE